MDMQHEIEEKDYRDHSSHQLEAMGMKMYFHFGLGDLLLFSGWKLDSPLKLSIACLVLFMGSILHEALNYFRGFICLCEVEQFNDNNKNKRESANDLENYNGTTGNGLQPHQARVGSCCTPAGGLGGWGGCAFGPGSRSYRLIQASLQFTRTALGLTIMLAAMTYNLCLIFAIVAGAGLGSYIFHRRRNYQDLESVCH